MDKIHPETMHLLSHDTHGKPLFKITFIHAPYNLEPPLK